MCLNDKVSTSTLFFWRDVDSQVTEVASADLVQELWLNRQIDSVASRLRI